MRIKADWDSYLHEIRTRQFNAVFDRCPQGAFAHVLELGAGDGFLSTLLADYCVDLISTDLNDRRLSRQDCGGISYQICDAEALGQRFEEKSFDLIFSSNLLEHLPDVDRALCGIHRVLKDDGITIHLLPNRNWKLVTVLLHIPNKMAKFIDRVLSGRIFQISRVRKPHRQPSTRNNPKLGPKRRRRFFLAKLLLPRIHGVAGNTLSEFIAFGKTRWIRQFGRCGFKILDVRSLGFSSGYGFGCNRLRKLMERLDIHTSCAYIACKAGRESNYAEYFQP
ncbi:MAG: methyltransferase domain-containing protein [Actinobacteria bacterium]|nr:methyltransferase domain-containing protein [Actinomycetota bacterium]